MGRYLLDVQSARETSYHSSLCPIGHEAQSDHTLAASPSAEELREFFNGIHREFTQLRLEIEQGKLVPQCSCHHSHVEARNPSPSLQPAHQISQLSTPSIPPPLPTDSQPIHHRKTHSNRPPPRFPEAVITKLKPGPNAWRDAVTQWEKPNEITKTKALKDWPLEWYTGAMSRVTGAQYHQRRCIAAEYYQ